MEGLGAGVRHGGFSGYLPSLSFPHGAQSPPGRGVGQRAMTDLPDGAGVWDEQEVTASLNLWHSRVSHSAGPTVWRDLDTSLEGLNNSAEESCTFP